MIYFKAAPLRPWWFSITIFPSPTGGVSINRWCHASLQLLQQWERCLCQAHLAAQCLHTQSRTAGITHPRGCQERYLHEHIRLSVKTRAAGALIPHAVLLSSIRSQRVSGAAAGIWSSHRHGAAGGGDATVFCLQGPGCGLRTGAATLR